ncbi:hypothetical protein NM688_g4518 [Phlebia brevispora]|uniref:Uncharacterized protein n=1 Tax=Phlebia brevispora TaxID=194682 RepID=A0ACC1T2W2_9APHY|nr:hypothetical protein NM688_g4518 [Phlebia brevispora]
MKTFALLAVLVKAIVVLSGPVSTLTEPDPSLAFSVSVDGQTFINKGLVAFGLIPSNFMDSTGNTMGGIGSAIAIKPGSFVQQADGTYTGTLVVQPDRGFNVDGTVDYQGRQHAINFVLNPHYTTSDLSFTQAQQTLALQYQDTLLYTERQGVKTSGLDAQGVRDAQSGFPSTPTADPVMPIANKTYTHLTLDLEGLVLNTDGTFWVSDEYGPYIYRFDGTGALIQTIQPPDAIVPLTNGDVDFTSEDDPDTGRAANQGMMTFPIIQMIADIHTQASNGGNKKSESRYTRLLAYDISQPLEIRPALIAEYVVPLPQDSSGDTIAASEISFVSDQLFLVLSRDSDGHGGDDTESSYKGIDLIDISSATNIAGSDFDSHKNPVAKKGKLDSSVTPATYTSFVSLINSTQLVRFGLHNGDPSDATLIDAKWESIALAPVGDPQNPHDFFVFTASDNDFITTDGISLGQPYNAGLDNDNQFLVFRVTLPTK